MRVFDFDGTIYDGESLFDLYLYSVRYDPSVLRYLSPVLRCAIRYKLGRATLEQMEARVGDVTKRYLERLSVSAGAARLMRRHTAAMGALAHTPAGMRPVRDDARTAGLDAVVSDFWDHRMNRIKPWYHPREDDVILTASFDLTVGEACRRLGVSRLISSVIDPSTLEVTYLNFNVNKVRRFREIMGDDAVIDEFYTDSAFDQPMIDLARRAYMVRGSRITRVK